MRTVTDNTDNSNSVTEDYDRGNLGLGLALCIALLLAAAMQDEMTDRMRQRDE